MTRALVALVALVLLACAGTVPAQQVPLDTGTLTRFWNATPREPTTMHLYIYRQMEECLGFTGEPFETIRWISADFLLRADYQRLGGLWISTERIIVLAHTRFNDPMVVSEELLHSLIPPHEDYPDPHDDPRFLECVVKPLVQ